MASGEPPKKDKNLNVRIDKDTYSEFSDKSAPYGGISRVLRAMIGAFLGGERNFDIDDLSKSNKRAKRGKK